MAAHILRQLATTTAAAAVTSAAEAEVPMVTIECGTDNEFDGRIGLRVSAIFVILIGSLLGAVFPVFAKRHQGVKVPEWTFFFAKYFGSGVIIATAFIHLLAPANEALTSPCLSGAITDYTWVEGIALMTIFLLFLVEVMAMRWATFSHSDSDKGSSDHAHAHAHAESRTRTDSSDEGEPSTALSVPEKAPKSKPSATRGRTHSQVPGDDHLSHLPEHAAAEAREAAGLEGEDYAAQLTAIFILEFGVIFHSIFIGLTLAVAGDEFDTLYVVLVFHQTFEGLGLGSRLAAAPWPAHRRRWTPYILAFAYALSTPIAIAVGLGLRNSYAPGSPTALIANGVFDSVSAGILIYTGLVELMAHEFMFSAHMRQAPLRVVLAAFGLMCCGAGLMALLGKWA